MVVVMSRRAAVYIHVISDRTRGGGGIGGLTRAAPARAAYAAARVSASGLQRLANAAEATMRFATFGQLGAATLGRARTRASARLRGHGARGRCCYHWCLFNRAAFALILYRRLYLRLPDDLRGGVA